MPGAEKVVTEVSKAFADILKRASTPATFGVVYFGVVWRVLVSSLGRSTGHLGSC